MRTILWTVGAVALSGLMGCGKPAPDVDLNAQEVRTIQFAKQTKMVGSLDYGQKATADYTRKPRYRAFKFGGQKGDQVDIWVRSQDGDAVAWLVDNAWHVIAMNDDAGDSTDAHLTATLPGNQEPDIVTYMIVFRDYYLDKASFTVSLDGTHDYTSCKVDADCVAISQGGCCPNGWNVAVNQSSVDDWQAAHACTDPHPICPLYVVNDTRVPECNNSTHQCELVAIDQVQCGGFILNAHQCPSGYQCEYDGKVPDLPGQCVAAPQKPQTCGGIAGLPCPAGQTCVDNPNDNCDPANGGADCSGICQ